VSRTRHRKSRSGDGVWAHARAGGSLSHALAAALSVAVGFGVSIAGRAFEQESVRHLTLLSVGLAASVGFFGLLHVARRDWFHPAALPMIYVISALMAPVAYLGILGESLGAGLEASAISPLLLATFCGTIAGLGAGVALGLQIFPRRREARASLDPYLFRLIGRGLLVVAVPIRLGIVLSRAGEQYGQGQLDRLFTAEAALDNFTATAFFAGVLMIVVANSIMRRRPLAGVDLGLVLAFAVATLVAGARGELIAPALAILWAYQTYVRRIPTFAVVALLAGFIVLFQGVGGARGGEQFYGGGAVVIERTLGGLATPLQTTAWVIAKVPETHPFTEGSTYLAAVKRQLPGPLAARLFDRPDDTGAFVLRRIIGFSNPNQGFGFSATAEGYLNFGLAGSLGVALLFGLLLGWAYRWWRTPPTRALEFLYPILLCTLPYNLRADALAQLKSVLYPLALLAVACYFARGRERSTEPTSAAGLLDRTPA